MTRRMAWRQVVGLSVLALTVSLAFLGTRALYNTTETRYATCAREMYKRGTWLSPTLEEKPHWSKPPLTYWAIAAGTAILGDNEWGVRLPGALAFCLTVLSVTWIGTRLFDFQTGILAGLIYTSAPFPVMAANIVSADTLLTLWMTLAVACFIEASRGKPEHSTSWVRFMWLAFGIGFFTKGPAALVPLTAIAIWNCRQPTAQRLFAPIGLLLFALPAFGWYATVVREEPGLLQHLLQTEILDRVSSSSVHNRAFWKAFTLYVPVLTLGLGYWLVPLFQKIRDRQSPAPSTLRSTLARLDNGGFLVLWITTGVGLFFLISSKLHLYVLPYIAPLSLVIAHYVSRQEGAVQRSWRSAVVSILCLIAIKGVLAVMPHPHDMRGLLNYIHGIPGVNTGTTIVQVNHPNEYGLSYYAWGRIERWQFGYAETRQRDFTARLLDASTSQPALVLVADTLDMSRMLRLFKQQGISFEHYNPVTPTNSCLAAMPLIGQLAGVALYDRGVIVVRQ